MYKIIILFFSILLLFTSCSSKYDERLKISTTNWVGYIPLLYIKERGWLEKLNIKLLNVSSLAENMYLYKAGNSDAFVGTQYEYQILKKDNLSLKPIIMFDRSNGGDLVMSNFSIEELQNTNKQIEAYLEIDSINNVVLKDFINTYNLKDKKINYINQDQAKIELLKPSSNPMVVVTYVPYNFALEKNGFKELLSTKDNYNLLVCDAMFTKAEIFNKHEKQFLELKKLIDQSIEILNKDPKAFYSVVKPYISDMNYDEFKQALDDIVWINKNMNDDLKNRLIKSNFPIRDLL